MQVVGLGNKMVGLCLTFYAQILHNHSIQRQKEKTMHNDVLMLTGAGQIGMAIARRMGMDKKIIIGDKNIKNADTIAATMKNAGFDAESMEMDLSSRK